MEMIDDFFYGACPAFQLFILENCDGRGTVQVNDCFVEKATNYYIEHFEKCSVGSVGHFLSTPKLSIQKKIFELYSSDMKSLRDRRCIKGIEATMLAFSEKMSRASNGMPGGDDVVGHFLSYICDTITNMINYVAKNPEMQKQELEKRYCEVEDKTRPMVRNNQWIIEFDENQ